MFPLSVYITSRSTNAEFYGYNILWLCAGASTPLNIHLFDLCDIFTANCHEGFKHIPGNDLKLSWQSEELLKLPDHGGDPLTDPSVRAPDHLLRLDLISLRQDDQSARLRTHQLRNGGNELCIKEQRSSYLPQHQKVWGPICRQIGEKSNLPRPTPFGAVANLAPAYKAPANWAPGGENWARQIGPQQIGPRQIGPRQIGPRQIRPRQIGPLGDWAHQEKALDCGVKLQCSFKFCMQIWEIMIFYVYYSWTQHSQLHFACRQQTAEVTVQTAQCTKTQCTVLCM